MGYILDSRSYVVDAKSGTNSITKVNGATLIREHSKLDDLLRYICSGLDVPEFPCDLIRQLYNSGYSWSIEDGGYLVYRNSNGSNRVKLNYWSVNHYSQQGLKLDGADFSLEYKSNVLTIMHNLVLVNLFFHDDNGFYVYRDSYSGSFYIEYLSDSAFAGSRLEIEFKKNGARVSCTGNKNNLFHFSVYKAGRYF